ncbi:MAG: PQQ-binding-like beta-propeller repeat protein [Candidatus Hydrogenedentes bacterium]|nr:PQQ-binding-like beta-propeller repeat protein [Candidatus Hydrogenedentota bacterium]
MRNRFLFSALLLLSQFSYTLDIEQLWVASPDMIMEGAPMVADLDGDGTDEILTAAYESLIVVDGSGKERWRFDTAGRYSTCPAILERDNLPPLLFAGDNKGIFTCLDGLGKIVWEKKLGNIFCASPVVTDLTGDGVFEVIQGDQAGLVTVLDANTGQLVWQTQLTGNCSNASVGDLDGDGLLDVVVATSTGELVVLDSAGSILWKFQMNDTAPFWAIASPVLFANSKGETRVAIASHSGHFFCLSNTGDVLWKRSTQGALASTLSVGDLDEDGVIDLFAVTELGVLYRFDENGGVLWNIETHGRCLAPGAIIDLDGDGTLEYILCTQRGNLLVFDSRGKIIFNYQFDNRTINVTAAFGDIVKERDGLEFAITGGESGQLFCFGTTAPTNSRAQWRTYRGNNHLTGGWFGLTRSDTTRMIPEALSWDQILTGDEIIFRVSAPTEKDTFLKATATCLFPNGARQAAMGKIVGGHGILKLPVSATIPGMYRFEWLLTNDADISLASGKRDIYLQPYQNDQAIARRAALLLRETLNTTTETTKKHIDIQTAIDKEAQDIEEEANALARLQSAVPGAAPSFTETLNLRTKALNIRSKRAVTLSKALSNLSSENTECPLLIFEGTTWENRDVNMQVPTEASTSLCINRRCVPGEHEPVSIKLLNVTLDTLAVRVYTEVTTNGPHVTAYEVKSVPTNQGTTAWDPIKPLANGTISIPSLETREVWLDLNLNGVKAGNHSVTTSFETGTHQTQSLITLKVLPFDMAPSGAMRLCCWASYTENALADLLAHGNNVFTAALPTAAISKSTPSEINIDFTALDDFLPYLSGHDVFLLMSGIPELGVPIEDDAYVPLLAEYLDRVINYLAKHGIDENHVAMYPHDEPGGDGWDTVNHYIAFGRQALKARPKLQLYVNGGGDLGMFHALDEVTSLWCPGYNMLTEDIPQMNFIKKSKKTIWSYDCSYSYARPVGANTKTINIAAQYRMAAIFGMHFGATGIGFWCYNVGDSMWDPVEHEYPLVYTNPDGTLTSCRRWEAVREGMEDVRILIALKEKLHDTAVSESVKEKIHHLLDITVGNLANQTMSEVQMGAARYVLDARNNDHVVEALRNEMLDCAALLPK